MKEFCKENIIITCGLIILLIWIHGSNCFMDLNVVTQSIQEHSMTFENMIY